MFRSLSTQRYSINPALSDKLLAKYDAASVTKSYVNLTQTATGTSGTSTITMSSSVATVVFIGMLIRLSGTDVYTVTNVVTTTITISGTLSTNYSGAVAAVERVSSWTDLSGKGNHATQNTDASKPFYIPSGINSLPTLKFNAQFLALPSGLYNNIANLNKGRQSTVFAVAKQTTSPAGGDIVTVIDTGNASIFLLQYDSFNSVAQTRYRSGSGTLLVSGAFTTTNFNLIRGVRSNNTYTTNINRGQLSVSNSTGVDPSNAVSTAFIGDGNASLKGEIAEIQIYKAFLSDADITNIENALSTKYNITLT